MKIRKLLILFLVVLTFISAIPVMANESDDDMKVSYSESEKEMLNSFITTADKDYYSDGCYYFEKNESNGSEKVKDTLVLCLTDQSKRKMIDDNIKYLRSSTKGTGSETFTDWDKSGTLWGNVTIEYSTSYVGDVQYALLKKVSVSRSEHNSGVTVTGQHVSYGCIGDAYEGIATGQNGFVVLETGTKSWSINTPSSWLPVSLEASHTIGCRYTITLTRGTSWDLNVQCNLY